MHRRWVRTGSAPVLLLALVLAGCDSGGEILGPQAMESAQFSVLEGHGQGRGGQGHNTGRVAEKVIDHAGGELTVVGGHSLVIPAGAVERPTLFRMTLLDDEGVIVDLSARVVDRPGKGKKGRGRKRGGDEIDFAMPVVLSLSYAGRNVDDPSIVWLVERDPNGPRHRIESSVDEQNQTVSAYLTHFSLYALAD